MFCIQCNIFQHVFKIYKTPQNSAKFLQELAKLLLFSEMDIRCSGQGAIIFYCTGVFNIACVHQYTNRTRHALQGEQVSSWGRGRRYGDGRHDEVARSVAKRCEYAVRVARAEGARRASLEKSPLGQGAVSLLVHVSLQNAKVLHFGRYWFCIDENWIAWNSIAQ